MTDPTKESGLGFFLKNERERKGLSREHLSKVTRLRMHYLEALENEDWGKLPSLVFIKGFIKTYTKALGLDYKEVMGQFESSIPVYNDLPKPLVPVKKTDYKKYTFLIVIVIFIVSIVILFLIINPLSFFKKADNTPTKGQESRDAAQNKVYPENDKQGQTSTRALNIDNPPLENNLGTTAKPETGTTVTNIQPSVPAMATQPMTAGSTVQTPFKKTTVKSVSEPVVKVNGKYALTGYVTSETYIKIYVDNEPPKEYIFSPGSYPQWVGNEGFYILVGNAAGIEFDLNGKRIKDLGDQGDVVRLRLPDSFKLNINE